MASTRQHHKHANPRAQTAGGETATDILFDGTALRIRPIAPADRQREAAFLARLPEDCRGFRFLGLIRQNGEAAAALTNPDPQHELSLIGLVEQHGQDVEVGVARFCADPGHSRCDCSVAVDPAWQGRGVAGTLMRHLIAAARGRGIRRMYAVDPVRCSGKHWLAEHLGFRPCIDREDPHVVTFELDLAR